MRANECKKISLDIIYNIIYFPQLLFILFNFKEIFIVHSLTDCMLEIFFFYFSWKQMCNKKQQHFIKTFKKIITELF